MEKPVKPKILFYDIETTPLLSYTWGLWEQNVIEVKEEWHILSFAYKFDGDKEVKVVSLPNFPGYHKNKSNDRQIVKKLWQLFNESDIVVGHNSDEFDNKKVQARFLKHGLPPPRPFKTVDTKKIAKRYFKFDSNKLDNLGKYLRLGEKLKTGGFELWLGCMKGDMNAWKTMCEYNKQDVVLLEKVYKTMLPYIQNHPNMNTYLGTSLNCPNCGKLALQKRGLSHTRTTTCQRYQCTGCGAWSSGNKIAR